MRGVVTQHFNFLEMQKINIVQLCSRCWGGGRLGRGAVGEGGGCEASQIFSHSIYSEVTNLE